MTISLVSGTGRPIDLAFDSIAAYRQQQANYIDYRLVTEAAPAQLC